MANSNTGAVPDRGSPPRMPRWVKTALIVLGILVLLFVVARVTGLGGEHGPGRHMPMGIGLTHQRGGA